MRTLYRIDVCKRRLFGAASAVAMAATMPMPSAAQTNLLEEIKVTAQRREQSLQDVGIAVTAFSGDQLRALDVTQSFELANFTPGVHLSGNLGGQNTQVTIRGVTQNDFNDIVEAPTAVYLDEGYIAVSNAQTFTTFDIDRVEILKGPQGTLFGRNATGGLVHYITRKPSFDETSGYADVTYRRFDVPSNANGVRVETAIGGPISEKLAARTALVYNYQGDLLQNLYPLDAVGVADFGIPAPFGNAPGENAGSDFGDDDTLAGRFILDYRATERTTVRLSFNGTRTNTSVGPYQSEPTVAVFNENGIQTNTIPAAPDETRFSIGPGGGDLGTDVDNDGLLGDNDTNSGELQGGRPVPGGDFFGYIDPDGQDFLTSSDFAFNDIGRIETLNGQIRVDHDLTEAVSATLIADYKHFQKALFIDVDAAPVNQSVNYQGLNSDTVTTELRFEGASERWNWTAGFYYLLIDSDADNGLKFPFGSVATPGSAFGVGQPFDVGTDAILQTNSYSVFGQAEYDFTERWKFIGGLRLIREFKDHFFQQSLYNTQDSTSFHEGAQIPIGPVNGQPFDAGLNDFYWSGKAQIEYRPNDDHLLYFGVNRGVKAASFNAQLSGGVPIPQEIPALGITNGVADIIPYNEEVLTNYEGGIKSTLFGGLGRLTANVFYYDYKDYQAFLFTGVAGVVINRDANTIGGELTFQVQPTDGLDVILSFAKFDAEVEDVPIFLNEPLVTADVEPTYAPETQFNATVRYEMPLFGGYASALGNVSYSDGFFFNLRNFDAQGFDSYVTSKVRLGWETPDGSWSAALFINNLNDARIGLQGFDLATLCGCNETSFRAPRNFGFNVRYSF